MSFKLNIEKTIKILAALGITVGLLYWCFRQVNLRDFVTSLEQTNLLFIFFAVLCTLMLLVLNSFQLKLFLPKFNLVSFKKMFQMVSIFSMTVNVVPFWGGHALLIYLLGHREKVGKTVALSVITLDQIIEAYGKIFVFAFVAFSGPFPEWLKRGVQAFIVFVIIAYGILFFFSFRFRDHVEDIKFEKGNLWGRIKKLIAKWAYHLHVLRNWRILVLTASLSILTKIFEIFAVYFTQISLGVDLGFSAAVLVVAALSLATTLPLTPGRLGLFEAGAVLAYKYLGVDVDKALALGVMIHAVHTLPFIVAGYFSSLSLGFKRGVFKVDPGRGIALAKNEA